MSSREHKEQGEVLGVCREDFGKLQGRAAWNCEWWQVLAQIVRKRTWKIKQARRERVGSRPRRLPNLSASRSKGTYRGAGSGGYRAKPCGGQPLTGRAGNRVCRCEEDFEDMSATHTIRRDAPGAHPCRRLP